jgi:hypothetical protein
MNRDQNAAPAAVSDKSATRPGAAGRPPYAPPRLERLGPWSALTLQQSVQIFP